MTSWPSLLGEVVVVAERPSALSLSDGSAIHDDVDGEISAVTEKASPVAADLLLMEDSAANDAKKRVQIGNLPVGLTTVRKTADQSVSTTTLTDDDDLLFSIGATEFWAFELWLVYTAGTTEDIKLDFTVPAGATGFHIAHPNYEPGGSISSTGTQEVEPLTTKKGYAGGGNIRFGLLVKAWVLGGGTAGTVQCRWSQNATGATATTVRAGSYLIAHKV